MYTLILWDPNVFVSSNDTRYCCKRKHYILFNVNTWKGKITSERGSQNVLVFRVVCRDHTGGTWSRAGMREPSRAICRDSVQVVFAWDQAGWLILCYLEKDRRDAWYWLRRDPRNSPRKLDHGQRRRIPIIRQALILTALVRIARQALPRHWLNVCDVGPALSQCRFSSLSEQRHILIIHKNMAFRHTVLVLVHRWPNINSVGPGLYQPVTIIWSSHLPSEDTSGIGLPRGNRAPSCLRWKNSVVNPSHQTGGRAD